MHYKNGRQAKPGDPVFNLREKVAGILYNANSQSTTCNGRLAIPHSHDPFVTLSECLHADDIAVAKIEDSSK